MRSQSSCLRNNILVMYYLICELRNFKCHGVTFDGYHELIVGKLWKSDIAPLDANEVQSLISFAKKSDNFKKYEKISSVKISFGLFDMIRERGKLPSSGMLLAPRASVEPYDKNIDQLVLLNADNNVVDANVDGFIPFGVFVN